jgi:ubiquinone/menaquinone biosynthesis C-methylase UbiE
MNIRDAYNNWAVQYDTNKNLTRDLEGVALKTMFKDLTITSCLEIGCGTGKNTSWLILKCDEVIAVDFSEAMLDKAKEKISSPKVKFVKANILEDWQFISSKVDLVVFSLVLEHIQSLGFIFLKTREALNSGGYVYIGELHPFKQYSGSKARFETEEGMQVLECYTHHFSDFFGAVTSSGFRLIGCKEFFDDENKDSIPRILGLLFQKID